jgi:outer membrane protein insertion porin family
MRCCAIQLAKACARFYLSAGLFISLIIVNSAAHAQQYQVEDIRIEGLQRVSAESIFAVLPVAVGESIDSADVAHIAQAIFASGNFRDVEIGIDNAVLIVKLLERPSISEINLEGNKAIKTEALLEGLSGQGMAEGRVFQRATLEGMQRELSRQYSAQGRYDAEIVTDVIAKPRNRVAVDIVIDEGKPATIKKINIVGNTEFSEKELLELMELKDRGFFARFNGSKKYAKEKLSGDLENIKDYYMDRGFIKFKLKAAQVSVGPSKDSIYISINIEEGDRYKIANVELAGDIKEQAPLLERTYLLGEGQIFSQALVTSTEEIMKRVMGNLGYAFAEIKNIPEVDEQKKTVDITFFVEPGKRTYVRRVNFSGNRKTNDDVMRREMRQLEGALASTDLIEASRVRLERLGFFKEVKVDTNEVPGTDDLVDVDFAFQEQAFGSVSASLGYSQDVGLIFGANLEQNNFLGTGKQVSLQTNRSEYRTQYGFSYVNPYYTADGVSRGFSLFFRETDFDEVNISSYSTNSYGGSVIFGYPLSETQSLRFSIGYTQTEIETGFGAVQEISSSPLPLHDFEAGYARSIDLGYDPNKIYTFSELDLVNPAGFDIDKDGFIDQNGDEFGVFTLTGSWRESTLNRGVFATRGHSNSISLEVTVPGSEVDYYRATFKTQYYFPMTRSLTLRLRGELGYGDGYGDVERLPFFENYFAGGIGSVRGYESNTLGPRSTSARAYDFTGRPFGGFPAVYVAEGVTVPLYVRDPANQQYLSYELDNSPDPFGGNILAEGSVEVIFPAPFLKDNRSVRTVLFYDFGNVFNGDCLDTQLNCYDFDLGELRTSAGVSLTWLSGFGPLSFSFAFPLQEEEFDEREQFQFTLGGSL